MDILIPEEVEQASVEWLCQKYHVVINTGLCKRESDLARALQDARTVLIRNRTQLPSEMLAQAPKLLGIGRLGVGLDNIDVGTASKLGMVVVAPLGANAVSVAELTLGLVIALARRIPFADRSTKAGGWERARCTGIELQDRVLAICGWGRIGRLVSQYAAALGLRIRLFDPYVDSTRSDVLPKAASFCSTLHEAVSEGDFVSLHIPLTQETYRLIDADAVGHMKHGAFLINTSRGQLVDEAALIDALQKGHLAGAALDVRECEPPAHSTGLEQMENVILTPHIGAFTHEAQQRTYDAVTSDLDRLLQGQPALHSVNFPASSDPGTTGKGVSQE